MADAGITEIGIITGETGDEIRAAVGDGSRWGVEHHLHPPGRPPWAGALRAHRRGLPRRRRLRHVPRRQHAAAGHHRVRRAFEADRAAADELTLEGRPRRAPRQILLTQVHDPQRFGVAELDADGHVIAPGREARGPAVGPGAGRRVPVHASIHEAVRSIEPSARGELEITDAIQWLIDNGHQVRHELLDGWWLDTGKKDPLLESNRRVLETIEPRIDGTVDAASRIDGRVVIEDGAVVVNCHVRGPAIIGERTTIADSYIGPFTSVADGCEIRGTEIEHSVILEESKILDVPRVDRLAHRQAGRRAAQRRPTVRHPAHDRRPLPNRARVEWHRSNRPTSSTACTSSTPTVHGDERGYFVETYRRQWFPQRSRDGPGQPRRPRSPGASSACTTTCTRPTTGTSPSVTPGSCCTTCAPGARPTVRRSASTSARSTAGRTTTSACSSRPGVAHGFASLTDMTITYLVDSYYNPADELGVAWDDPAIDADWGVDDPILSDRDQANPRATTSSRSGSPTPPSAPDPCAPDPESTTGRACDSSSPAAPASSDPTTCTTCSRPPTTRSRCSTRSPTPATSRTSRTSSDDPRFTFVHGDICDREAVGAAMPGHDAVVHFAAESHVDRSLLDPDVFVRTNCDGTNVMCDLATPGRRRAVPAHLDRRGLRLDRGGLVRRDRPAGPSLAVLGGQGRLRPDRPRVPRDLRAPGGRHPVVEPVRAVPVPREAHPVLRHEPARRPPGPALRRRAERPRLALRRGQLRRRRPGAAHGRDRRDLQHRRRQRADQPRDHRPSARRCSAATSRWSSTSRTASATTGATRSRPTRSAQLGWAPAHTLRRRARSAPSRCTSTTATGGSRCATRVKNR